jgi:hypothetical protein
LERVSWREAELERAREEKREPAFACMWIYYYTQIDSMH